MKKLVTIFFLIIYTAYANPYGKCVGCHGANGEKIALGKSKVIKDMTKAEIKTAMIGYKNNTYGGTMKGLMVAQSISLSEEDINTIAEQIGK